MGNAEYMGSGFSTADKKIIIFTLTKQHFTFTMKIALCFLAIVSMTLAAPTPQRVGASNNSKNGNNSPNTRFFTGNQAIDSAAFGAAAGVAGNYLFNAVTNPCRNRNGNRNNNKGTNNRIFGGNTGNFLLGAVGGFAGAQLFNNAQGNPCNNLFSGR